MHLWEYLVASHVAVLLPYLVVRDLVVGDLEYVADGLLVGLLGPVDKVYILHNEVVMVKASDALGTCVALGIAHVNLLVIIYNSSLIID